MAEGVAVAESTTSVTEQLEDDTVATPTDETLVEDVLVEEVSIDGMCGVY